MIKKFDDFIDLWFFAWQFFSREKKSFFQLVPRYLKKTKFWKVSCLLSDFIDGITTKFMGFTRNIYSYFRSQQSLIVSLEKSRLISKFSWPFGLFFLLIIISNVFLLLYDSTILAIWCLVLNPLSFIQCYRHRSDRREKENSQ